MRLDINLASQPYEDARQFWLRWGPAMAAMGIVTLVILSLTITGWFTARRDRATIGKLHSAIAERDTIRAGAEAFLNQPEHRTTRDESQILNELIVRKSFSWTRVLEDMEKVMPSRVHLVSINPGLDEENQLTLKMVVAGDSREKAIELAQRMEESKRFSETTITTEHYSPTQSGSDTETFDIEAIYVPETVSVSASSSSSAGTAAAPKAKVEISRRSAP
jgi:type IV pilus assembly protein PilN